MNNNELPRLNFVELRSKFKLIPSLILPTSSFNVFNCSDISRTLGITIVCSSFAHILQGNHITKHNINTLSPTMNLDIVNNSSSISVTIFTSFSSIKGYTLHVRDSTHNPFNFLL